MQPDRREFLKHTGFLAAAGAALATGTQQALAAATAGESHEARADPDKIVGVLVDTTACVGCRLCEYACKEANGLPTGDLAGYDDQSVFTEHRRPSSHALTVVNAFDAPAQPGKPVYAKINCMHCNHCACASACIVGALHKQENGAVTYDAWKCIGCRYCMVACPFQLPAYSYDDALTPQIFKCQLCFHDRTSKGLLPGCVSKCPVEALVFGKREELIKLAHDRIAASPGKYIDHVYGEHEVGGTSWMYLSAVPFEQIGLPKFGDAAPPALTEKIQHGVFKHGLPPMLWYGFLGAVMYVTKPRKKAAAKLAGADDGKWVDMTVGHRAMALGDGDGDGEVHAGAVALAEAPRIDTWRGGSDGRAYPADPDARHDHDHGHHHDEEPAPIRRKLFTPGVWVLLAMMAAGLVFLAKRFLFGLGNSTNLDQQHPWGLWIAIDVASGVALAAGGFMSALIAHIFHRDRYHAISRPALLTAMLGYTFVCLGLQADLGRYYNVWHPMVMWNGNSVLFEVGICVMIYLHVLYLEFAPVVCERYERHDLRFPKLTRLAKFVRPKIESIMFLLVIAGVVLSSLHQSSLGNLMVIAPYKVHPLWWTPISSLLFLLSAAAVGFPMIIFESLFAGWSMKLRPELDLLSKLARYIPILLGLYGAVKIGDMIVRGTHVYLGDGSLESRMWLIEMIGGVAIPVAMMLVPRLRRSLPGLFTAATLAVLGVVLNRINVFLIAYNPPYAVKSYFPAAGEIVVTVGLVAALMFAYRVMVTYFPVLSQPKAKAAA